MASLRLQAGLRLAPHVVLLAGAGVNVAVGDRRAATWTSAAACPSRVERSGATTVRIYPGLLLGLQI